MNKNKNLNTAAKAKKDEFYTQLRDIENEVRWYWKHLPGKTILCNCDDPFESQFFFYFAMQFNHLKLKKLIATSYATSPIMGDLFNPVEDTKVAYKVEINEIQMPGRDYFDWRDVTNLMEELKTALGDKDTGTVGKNTLSILKGDGKYLAGDFRSAECIAALEDSDIVVTNPPFSLFREFVSLLVENDKKFLVIGNVNAITYKEIFPLIMQNKAWLGVSIHSGDREMRVPDDYELRTKNVRTDEKGIRYIRVPSLRWYTNLEHDQRHRPFYLVESYERTPEKFPQYDNYDAIEISKTLDIPKDYYGVMGVPITFLDKYCPEQFEILGLLADKRNDNPLFKRGTPTYLDEGHKNYVGAVLNGKATYARILIRRRA